MIAAWPSPAGTSEYALAFDRGREKRVLVLPAWFEEGNKLRRLTVEIMRRLDGAGIDTFFPDLPGCNESEALLEAQTVEGWSEAAEAAASHFAATHVLAFRAAALIAPDLPGWRYAPVSGSQLLRGLLRARTIAAREAGREETREGLLDLGKREGLELAGHRLGATMITELQTAEPLENPRQRVIAQGDIGGAALWLRAEPDYDHRQADALAAILTIELISTPARGELVEPRLARPIVLRQAQDERNGMQCRHLQFHCAGAKLAGTLDVASGSSGLLIVTGGNETRAGAFSGQAQLAAKVAAAGHPVFRFDRRGVGDSEGVNMGFRHSGEDIAAALAAFRAACPSLRRIVAFGNCDAASVLMLGSGCGADALVLSNPWTYDEDEGESAPPPPAAIRARYLEKLRNPREVWRLLTGGVDLRKLARGLSSAATSGSAPSGLAGEMQQALAGFSGPVRFLVAGRDRTGQAFLAAWDKADRRIAICPGADHAYSDEASQEWLLARLLDALR